MKNYLFILLIVAATNGFCQVKVENNVQYKTVKLKADDGVFLSLKRLAQKRMPEFVDSLKKNGADYKNFRFIVKSDFVEQGSHEHMWSRVFVYNKEVFKAIFIDSPFTIKNIKTGDKILIRKSDIEDWVIYKNEVKVAGDFSEKYLNSKQ
ncbi:Uncharacterized conserved protein YegJ, DUF2314 family [Mucilaginibacter pineti]|uniref:Uncharacterized conserved protein YegJ, DUF2314 family n=1 Tax=Mucilaginibacter pineti TaxID=1391627 RepID=A0A1G6W2A2_9SPHI|nr:DUF2314 domain-containing protein [Mucilaginibacter pineti]SDD59367.1 Uncharacterized conserved protein YegJ, DUF2314 family [Mucilaginibacter pineti]